jgi:hypothetical protein
MSDRVDEYYELIHTSKKYPGFNVSFASFSLCTSLYSLSLGYEDDCQTPKALKIQISIPFIEFIRQVLFSLKITLLYFSVVMISV